MLFTNMHPRRLSLLYSTSTGRPHWVKKWNNYHKQWISWQCSSISVRKKVSTVRCIALPWLSLSAISLEILWIALLLLLLLPLPRFFRLKWSIVPRETALNCGYYRVSLIFLSIVAFVIIFCCILFVFLNQKHFCGDFLFDSRCISYFLFAFGLWVVPSLYCTYICFDKSLLSLPRNRGIYVYRIIHMSKFLFFYCYEIKVKVD